METKDLNGTSEQGFALKPHIENLLKERYYLKSETSWAQVSRRVSETILPEMEELILSRTFIPSTPTLMNLNSKGERHGTLSSCFILGIEDSLDGIMDSMKEAAFVTKAAGGVGFNFSRLRGSNENVKSISANSGGVMAFIQIFDSVLDGVRQGGRRRGAGMSLLSIYHPNILKFIDAKVGSTKVYTRSNFSVVVDTEFYNILETEPDTIFQTRNVVDGLRNDLLGEGGIPYTYKMLWDKIMYNAWLRGEPGIYNIDLAVDRCSCKHITKDVFCNPCSEFCHIPYTSCNLASFNIIKFTNGKEFDWKAFEKAIETSVIYMNGIVDANDYPLEKIRKETLGVRPIGLGLMGVAHSMALQGIKYDSQEGCNFLAKLARFETLVAMRKSMELARDRGTTFPYYDCGAFIDASKRFFIEDEFMGIDVAQLFNDIKKYGIYNSCVTSIAPTGTISFIADCSSGIEPVFGLVFTRKIEKENKEYEYVYIVDPIFEQFVKEKHADKAEEIYRYVSDNKGSCQGCAELSQEEQDVFRVAGDISPEWHVKTLAAAANNVSLSISKTINLSRHSCKEDLSKVFVSAHKLGVIGVTVYRDGSREGILVHKDDEKKEEASPRPIELNADVHHLVLDGKKYYVVVGMKDGKPYEVFVSPNYDEDGEVVIPKSVDKGVVKKMSRGKYNLITHRNKYHLVNGHNDDLADATARLISCSLQGGVHIEAIVNQLHKTSGSIVTFSKLLARTLKKYIPDDTKSAEECSECGTNMVYKEGCKTCPACGNSKCG